jgi:hypothetical protein
VTSEELELSLKAEFESYLSGTLNGLRQDVAEFQKNFEAEFAKHRSQMDDAIAALSARFESTPALDRGFTESVIEHLRLARDEGAQLAASAFTEAEKLQDAAAPEARYDQLRNAVNDISGRVTQVEILSTLIEHASHFAPRGTFFIVKGENLVAWQSFGEGSDQQKVSDVKMPVTADTIVGAAVVSSFTVEGAYGSHADDDLFVSPMGLGRPDRMYAIPLVARGRSVAVLYADYGTEGIVLNIEALETLVRVAGLTVELRASAKPAAAHTETPQRSVPENAETETEADEPQAEFETPQYSAEEVTPEYQVPEYTANEAASEPEAYFAPEAEQPVDANVYEFEATAVEEADPIEEVVYEDAVVDAQPVYVEEYASVSQAAEVVEETSFDSYSQPQNDTAEEHQAELETIPVEAVEAKPAPMGFAFTPAAPAEDTSELESTMSVPAPEFVTNGFATEPAVEAVVSQAGRSRLSQRNIDLPIEVSDDERKLHNNARRFARLLVSEIKLYNEQQVVAGRDSGDLYVRLREAIDRSREMYDRRVEPAVAAKFDYFHYELINDLASGDPSKLGAGYPGAIA